MKRDFDLIRKILLTIEADSSGEGMQLPELLEKIPGYEPGLMGYNIDLMIKAGLIEGEVFGYPIQDAMIQKLEWTGHDFLDNARSENVWSETKSKLVKVGGSASMEVFKELLVQSAKTILNLP